MSLGDLLPSALRRWLRRRRRFVSTWNTEPFERYLDPAWHENGDFPRSQQIVVDYLAQFGAASLLDLPCGNARLYRGLVRAGLPITYLGSDLTPKCVEASKQLHPERPFVRADIGRLPFASRSIDVIVVQHLLRHLPTYEPALRELLRVARRAVIVVEKQVATGERDERDCYRDTDTYGSWFWVNAWAPEKLFASARAIGASATEWINDARRDDPNGQYSYVLHC